MRADRKIKIFERDGWECQYCGLPLVRGTATIDHVHPLSLGGDHSDGNLRTACHACNSTKLDRSERWLRLFIGLGQTKYADIITLDQYHRLRGIGVALDDLPEIRFFFELKEDLA